MSSIPTATRRMVLETKYGKTISAKPHTSGTPACSFLPYTNSPARPSQTARSRVATGSIQDSPFGTTNIGSPSFTFYTPCWCGDITLATRSAQAAGDTEPRADASVARVVEAGCGTCIFYMTGLGGCPLAVRMKARPTSGRRQRHRRPRRRPRRRWTAQLGTRGQSHRPDRSDTFVAESFVLQD